LHDRRTSVEFDFTYEVLAIVSISAAKKVPSTVFYRMLSARIHKQNLTVCALIDIQYSTQPKSVSANSALKCMQLEIGKPY